MRDLICALIGSALALVAVCWLANEIQARYRRHRGWSRFCEQHPSFFQNSRRDYAD